MKSFYILAEYRRLRKMIFEYLAAGLPMCRICHKELTVKSGEFDHVVPKSKGGPDVLENLQLLCSDCNKLKGNSL